MNIVMLILAAALGYALGSLNMGIIVGAAYGVDLKKKGSGNAGLTNAYRVLGSRAAVAVFIGDALKAVLACYFGYLLTKADYGPEKFIDLDAPGMGLMIAGAACVVGHIFPAYFSFGGGKGVLTTVAVVSLMDFRMAGILLLVFIIVLVASKIVSLGSLVSAACLPIAAFAMGKPSYAIFYCFLFSALVIFMHRSNITRLINRSEPRIKIN